MNRVLIGGAAALLLLALVPVPAYAQSPITGVVRDSSGAVLSGVTVEAASPASSRRFAPPSPMVPGRIELPARPGAYT